MAASKRVRVLAMGIEAHGLERLAERGILLARRYTAAEITEAALVARAAQDETISAAVAAAIEQEA